MLTPKEAQEIIRFKLSKNRFKHSLQVASTAREMAGSFGVDPEKAYLVGLLHDYAKGMSSQGLLAIAESHNLIEHEVDRLLPDLLHAPVGAVLLQEELGIVDREILNAVKYHSLGDIKMSDLDKIIYLADIIEPGRDFPGIERLRCMAFRNLNDGILFGLDSTIKYCIERGRILHPRTVTVRNHFLAKLSRDLTEA